jgi:hypothetical protein
MENVDNTPYSVAEVAKLTGFSPQMVTRLFENEKGVLIFQVNRPRKRATYRTIRIPRHVYTRVLRKISVA